MNKEDQILALLASSPKYKTAPPVRRASAAESTPAATTALERWQKERNGDVSKLRFTEAAPSPSTPRSTSHINHNHNHTSLSDFLSATQVERVASVGASSASASPRPSILKQSLPENSRPPPTQSGTAGSATRTTTASSPPPNPQIKITSATLGALPPQGPETASPTSPRHADARSGDAAAEMKAYGRGLSPNVLHPSAGGDPRISQFTQKERQQSAQAAAAQSAPAGSPLPPPPRRPYLVDWIVSQADSPKPDIIDRNTASVASTVGPSPPSRQPKPARPDKAGDPAGPHPKASDRGLSVETRHTDEPIVIGGDVENISYIFFALDEFEARMALKKERRDEINTAYKRHKKILATLPVYKPPTPPPPRVPTPIVLTMMDEDERLPGDILCEPLEDIEPERVILDSEEVSETQSPPPESEHPIAVDSPIAEPEVNDESPSADPEHVLNASPEPHEALDRDVLGGVQRVQTATAASTGNAEDLGNLLNETEFDDPGAFEDLLDPDAAALVRSWIGDVSAEKSKHLSILREMRLAQLQRDRRQAIKYNKNGWMIPEEEVDPLSFQGIPDPDGRPVPLGASSSPFRSVRKHFLTPRSHQQAPGAALYRMPSTQGTATARCSASPTRGTSVNVSSHRSPSRSQPREPITAHDEDEMRRILRGIQHAKHLGWKRYAFSVRDRRPFSQDAQWDMYRREPGPNLCFLDDDERPDEGEEEHLSEADAIFRSMLRQSRGPSPFNTSARSKTPVQARH